MINDIMNRFIKSFDIFKTYDNIKIKIDTKILLMKK